MLKKIKEGIVGDMVLNTIAAAIPVVFLQLLVLPYLGREMDSEQYGLLLTLLSVFNLIPATLGASLNNIRLLYRKKYENENEQGDFQIILFSECIISIVLVVLLTLYYSHGYDSFNIINFCLIAIITILWILREYYTVAFLINIRYDCILINNIIMVVGYLLGVIIFGRTGYWEYIYILGYSFSLIYIMIKTDIWKERLIKTSLFEMTNRENAIYLIACLLYRMTSYADKMLLFPIIGGTFISIYHTATLSGKMISMFITPISGVMLTYLSRMNSSSGGKSFRQVLKIGTIVCVVIYFLCLIVSVPILEILYPQYSSAAMVYIPITTGTIILGVMASLLNPYVLRFLSMTWQFIINAITVISYIVLSFVLLHFWGLMGFCIGCMISSALKLLTIIIIYNKGEHRDS